MTSTAHLFASFAYIRCDIPPGQTLTDWRGELEAARRAEREALRARRAAGRRERYFPRLPSLWVST